jgi:hypothetical protein
MFLVIGGVAILVARRFKPGAAGVAGRDLAVLESVRVGRDGFVYLLRVGTGRYLLAKTKDGAPGLLDVTKSCQAKDDSAPAVRQ